MKKLLAAATSFAMTLSVMTSAFASSITVSAAGGVSAVQPNVSMEDAIDGAANKKAPTQSNDFFVRGGKYEIEAGHSLSEQKDENGFDVNAEFIVQSGGHKAASFTVELPNNLPNGITLSMTDNFVYCIESLPTYAETTATVWNAAVFDDNSDPQSIVDGVAACQFDITVDKNVAPGTYEIGLKRFQVVESGDPKIEFYAVVEPIILTVTGPTQETTAPPVEETTAPPVEETTAPPAQETTAPPAQETTAPPVEETTTPPAQETTAPPAQVTTAPPAQVTTKAPTTTEAPKSTYPNAGNLPYADDFTVTGGEYTIEAGHKLSEQKDDNGYDMAGEFIVSPGNHKAATFVVEIADVPAGFTVTMDDKFCYAIESLPSYTSTSKTVWNASVFDENSDPQAIIDGAAVCQFEIAVDKSVAPGTYYIDLARFQVVENSGGPGNTKIEFLAKVEPIKVIVPGESKETTTKAPTQETTKPQAVETTKAVTTTKAPTTTEAPKSTYANPGNLPYADDFILNGGEYTIEAGHSLSEQTGADGYPMAGEFIVTPGNHKAATFVAEIAELPAGITVKMTDPFCYAIATMPQYSATSKTVWNASVFDDKSDPQSIIDGAAIVQYDITVDSTVAPGTYYVDLARFQVVENAGGPGNTKIEFLAKVNPITVIVPGKSAETTAAPAKETTAAPAKETTAAPAKETTAAPAKETTAAPVKETTAAPAKETTAAPAVVTTKPAPADGKAVWDIPEVTAKAGGQAVLKVIVSGASDLKVAGASYTIVADGVTLNAVAGPAAAYGNASVISNLETQEIAFAQKDGVSNAAADGAVIMTLTYDVPATAKGVIPVNWSNAVISDTEGNIITDKVTLADGEIKIEDDIQQADGEAKWVIDTVTAAPGSDAVLKVYVEGNSDLKVAGASYVINADAELKSVTGPVEAYGNAGLVVNKNEMAFAQKEGVSNAASDNAKIMTLTYKVPVDAKDNIPVKWSDMVVSDTNGLLVTDQVNFVDGLIMISDIKPADGEAEWLIPEVNGTPGETVEMTVIVNGESTLPVGGASFAINADATLDKAEGPVAAYDNSALVVNKNEMAFAQTKGEGIVGKSNGTILTLTYTVPANATEDIPVKWSDMVVSDTNGLLVTNKVKFTDGVIKLTKPAEGKVEWKIPEVPGTPGGQVTMTVIVNGESTLPVGGASFVINADATLDKAEGPVAAYNSAGLVVNKNEMAFAQKDGKGVVGTSNGTILTLTYTVPADAKDNIPVKWSDMVVSDTNGLLITDKVTFTDGLIIIKPVTTTEAPVVETTTEAPVVETTTTAAPVVETTTAAPVVETTTEAPVTTTEAPVVETTTEAPVVETTTTVPVTTEKPVVTTTAPVPDTEGEAEWLIPTVTGVPGEEVVMTVIVNGETNLPVGGASFVINSDAEFVSAVGPVAAYDNSALITNKNEMAFAQTKGEGVVGTANGTILTLTYKVPADATDNIPVVWADMIVSDTEGRIITDKVKFTDGLIIINKVTTTEAPVTTVTTEAPVVETTTEAPVVETTTAAPVVETTTAAPVVETTTAAPVVETTTAPVTTVTVAKGSIIWQGETVTAVPGGTVELSFVVSDPNGSALEIAGANFIVDAAGNIVATDASGSEGYGANVIFNPDTMEVAFGTVEGVGVSAADGSTVVTFKFSIPEGIEDGDYNVNLTGLRVVDTEGNDITANVTVNHGVISISRPVTTVTTTEEPVVETTTAEPVVETTTAEPVVETTTAEPVVETTTAEPVVETTTAEPVVETTTAEPVVETTTAEPVVETTTTAEPVVETTTTAEPVVETTTTAPVTTTAEPVVETTTTAPVTTEEPIVETTTEAPVTVTTTTGDGNVAPGTVTTTTRPYPELPPTAVVAKVETVDGFYFSHDDRPFRADHVSTKNVVDNETGEVVEFNPALLDFEVGDIKANNPAAAFTAKNYTADGGFIAAPDLSSFVYTVSVLYDGREMYNEDGSRVTFTAYIGVKGDSDFDFKADSTDASAALVYYAKQSTLVANENGVKDRDSVRLSTSKLVDQYDLVFGSQPTYDLDQFAAFLTDVDNDCYSKDNWKKRKGEGRQIMSDDASFILVYYAKLSTTPTDQINDSTRRKAWNDTLGNGRGDKLDNYKASGIEIDFIGSNEVEG